MFNFCLVAEHFTESQCFLCETVSQIHLSNADCLMIKTSIQLAIEGR